jgi:hypothetical protein
MQKKPRGYREATERQLIGNLEATERQPRGYRDNYRFLYYLCDVYKRH